MDIQLDAVDMELRATFPQEGNHGLVPGAGSAMKRLDYLVELKSPADQDRILQLMEEAERHCFASNSLREPVPVVAALRLNGQPLPFMP
jgi:hypothetical protein